MATSTRRQPVAQGGLFSTPKASFSKETQELLKGERTASSQMDHGIPSSIAMKKNRNISSSLFPFCMAMYSDDARVQTD